MLIAVSLHSTRASSLYIYQHLRSYMVPPCEGCPGVAVAILVVLSAEQFCIRLKGDGTVKPDSSGRCSISWNKYRDLGKAWLGLINWDWGLFHFSKTKLIYWQHGPTYMYRIPGGLMQSDWPIGTPLGKPIWILTWKLLTKGSDFWKNGRSWMWALDHCWLALELDLLERFSGRQLHRLWLCSVHMAVGWRKGRKPDLGNSHC